MTIAEFTIADRSTAISTLMRARAACRESGEIVTVHSPFEDGPTRLVDVPVIAIDVAAQKFQVKRVGDDIGKWFAIRHIQSITLRSGETLASPDGEAYWKEIRVRRGWKFEHTALFHCKCSMYSFGETEGLFAGKELPNLLIKNRSGLIPSEPTSGPQGCFRNGTSN